MCRYVGHSYNIDLLSKIEAINKNKGDFSKLFKR